MSAASSRREYPVVRYGPKQPFCGHEVEPQPICGKQRQTFFGTGIERLWPHRVPLDALPPVGYGSLFFIICVLCRVSVLGSVAAAGATRSWCRHLASNTA